MLNGSFLTTRYLLFAPLILLLVLAVGCGAAATATPAPVATPTAVRAAEATPTPVAIPQPAATLAPEVSQVKRGGVLKFVPQGSIKSLDPMWTTAYVTTKNFANYVYEGLFAVDAKWQAQPMLVDKWEVSPDGLRYLFTLRKGLTFHNGGPVTVKDTVESYKRYAGREAQAKLLMKDFIGTIEAVDDRTVAITMRVPTGALVPAMSLPIGFRFVLMPESLWSVPAAEGAKEAIGTGPFKVVSWNPGDRYVLERWADYKPRSEPLSFMSGNKTVYVDGLEAIEIPDHATRVAALETGEIDFLDEFKSDFAERVRKNPNLNLHLIDPGSMLVLIMNQSRPPFNDVRARRAVVLAYPVEKAMAAVGGDRSMWSTCAALWNCKSQWANPGKLGAEKMYNTGRIAEAKALVQEAGLTGAKVRLMSPEDVQVAPASLVTQEVLQALGFDVEFQAMDWATVVTKRAQPEAWELFHTWGDFSFNGLSPLINSLIQKDGWFNKYQDPSGDMMKAFNSYARATTLEEQKKLAGEMERVYWEDIPFFSVGEFLQVMASRKAVKNYTPYIIPLFWGVWLER